MLSRRRFLVTLPALAVAPRLAAAQSFLSPFRQKPIPPQPVFVYFGTDTAKGIARGIYLSRFDPASGLLTLPSLVAETLRPSFLALSPNTVAVSYTHLKDPAVNDAIDIVGVHGPGWGGYPTPDALALNKPCLLYTSLAAAGLPEKPSKNICVLEFSVSKSPCKIRSCSEPDAHSSRTARPPSLPRSNSSGVNQFCNLILCQE